MKILKLGSFRARFGLYFPTKFFGQQVLTKVWIFGFLPKLGVKSAYFHDFEKWQGGFCNSSDEYVVVTSKRAQGMYFRPVQLLSSYLEPSSKNRNFKILKNGHFGSFFGLFFTVF